ncbi:MAG TPA: hypothetical protein PK625_05545, partial [Spirochaetales bacterium]|nr:hypothetical protein [Spirochaetales bacterium]
MTDENAGNGWQDFWNSVGDAITGAQRGSTVTLKKYLTGDDGEYQARRFAAGGLFGHYLGYAPIFKKAPNVDDGLSASILKPGSGEYGRLL